jgi:hypothetical protein
VSISLVKSMGKSLLKGSLGKILRVLYQNVRRILKRKIAEIWLFARLFKPCKTLNTYKGGLYIS